MELTQNLHIRDVLPLMPPRALKAELPMSEAAHRTVVQAATLSNASCTRKTAGSW